MKRKAQVKKSISRAKTSGSSSKLKVKMKKGETCGACGT